MAFELSTPLETICRLIIRGREMEAQVPGPDPDDEEEPDDADDEFAVLDDELNEAVEEDALGAGGSGRTIRSPRCWRARAGRARHL